jgi:hypothetical protein
LPHPPEESAIITDGADKPFSNSPRVRYLPNGDVLIDGLARTELHINGRRMLVAVLEPEAEKGMSVPLQFAPGLSSRPIDALQALSSAHAFLLLYYSRKASVGDGRRVHLLGGEG